MFGQKEKYIHVLQMLSKLFDPLGLMNPFVISAQIMFQKIWTCGLDWDEPLPEELASTWTRWVYDFPSISEISVTRDLGLPESGKVELHVFSDASKEAYAAVAYVRVLKNDELMTNVCPSVVYCVLLKELLLLWPSQCTL